ncbi:MAG: ornithine carbamoyltransferase [Gemmatimonadota bacterium]|jgi:ornithine carbamoyltransferase|nr:ornithine carbamoyltransferase [Gemmatimonadota bacterium]MDP6461981.1 ornithine carbamoyltransferase [Gemmatimonadota bacterium]MDP6529880.1 ornithine carbamoyltransferase [Gemmatimonadota bacterium]MDP6801707.1 ornithine carbamoyltransferase [Gemmatimonadota bacterium]MDP7031217.1 ornithine carbamoyltransferase [Gemmatimonadota bacterium]
MTPSLRGRHFLTLLDYTPGEIAHLLDLSASLKAEKAARKRPRRLDGMNIALLFEKPSTRTRCAFTVAAADEGAHPEYLGRGDIQIGKKESVKDTARVLGRMFDGIQFRGFRHETVEELARWAGVPVWNGLTDRFHPTQILADFLTVRENFDGRLDGIRFAYLGDGRNNMANSLMAGAARTGMDFRIGSPESLRPEEDLVARCRADASETGGRITLTDSVDEAVEGADVLYTDVWASMGEEDRIEERIHLLGDYRITEEMFEATGNANAIFLHCLPCFHDTATELASAFPGIQEATDGVFEGDRSRVFDQAENRMHTIKAVMVATLAG